MNSDIPVMISLKEASQRTGLSYECLRNLCLTRKIVHFRSGKKYLVNYERLIEFLSEGGVSDE